jgi:hypothetical protein
MDGMFSSTLFSNVFIKFDTARVKCKNSRKTGSNSYTQIASLLPTSASGKSFVTQTSTGTRAHIFSKYKTGTFITYTDGSPMQDEISKQQF